MSNLKHKLLLIVLNCMISSVVFSQSFLKENITLKSRWFNINETSNSWNGNLYSGMWAWKDSIKQKQYAIVGAASGYYFVDVTNTTNPILIDSISGRLSNAVWREIKTYSHYAYLVSDDNINNFIIADLQYLPDSVHVVKRTHDKLSHAHALWIDGNKLYTSASKIYNNASKLNFTPKAMSVFSLVDPENPLLLRHLEQDFPSTDNVHDMFVRNDSVFASSSYSGLFIFKYNNTLNKFEYVSNISNYTQAGYNHSSALTPTSNKLIMCDEVPAGLPIKIIDVSNLISPIEDTAFYNMQYSNSTVATGATAHNPFIISDKFVLVSYYRDGTVIFDISNPKNPIRVGYFDSYMQDNNGGVACNYCGVWGSYTQLPNNIVLSLDMQNGLFVLDINDVVNINSLSNKSIIKKEILFYPNPSSNYITITNEYDYLVITDVLGNKVFETFNKNNLIDISKLNIGIYSVFIKTDNTFATQKFVKN